MWSYWCYDGLHGSVSERVLDFFLGGGGLPVCIERLVLFLLCMIGICMLSECLRPSGEHILVIIEIACLRIGKLFFRYPLGRHPTVSAYRDSTGQLW